MTDDQIKQQQDEQLAAFRFALSDFAARLNFIDDATPGGDIPPEWWLKLSELRREVLRVAREVQ